MNQSKLRFSLIIILVAVSLLVTGTFAWFAVGRLASLGSLSFGVIGAGDGVEIQGSAGSAYIMEDENNPENLTLVEWGKYLQLDNFKNNEILKPDSGTSEDNTAGVYVPVSPSQFRLSETGVTKFIRVTVTDDVFSSQEVSSKPDDPENTSAQYYNDFSINLRSETSNAVNVEVHVNIHAADGAVSASSARDGDIVDATTAARVAITYNGETRVFARNDSGSTYVVSSTFTSINDSNGNRVIDTNENSSVLSNLNVTKLEVAETDEDGRPQIICTGNMVDSSGNYIDNDGNEVASGRGYILNNVSNNNGFSTIYIQTWIEGNDPDCVDLEGRSISNGSFITDISFSAYNGS